jgi:hypothetical protein
MNLNVIKLIDSIGHLMKTNHLNRIQTLEKEMRQHISKFLLPRSLANSEDIEYLKWLLNEKNFHLTLCQPIIYSAVCTQDRLTFCEQTDYTYLLNVTNLNVKLVEKSSLSSEDHDSLNTTSGTSSSSDDDQDEEEIVDACQENVKDKKFYVKFINERMSSSDINELGMTTDEFCGSLLISYRKIKKIIAKEKTLIEKCRMNKIKSEMETSVKEKNKFLITEDMLAGEDFFQKQKRALELYRQRIMSTPNFRGAKCLLNIKNKQILNKKTNGTSNLLKLASVVPISNGIKNNPVATDSGAPNVLPITVSINTNGIGSNCSSLSSSISPSASSTSSSTNSIKGPSRLKPRKIQKFNSYTNGTATQTSDENTSSSSSYQSYLITYSDLNERLFSCLLSNFSCRLVDNFLKTSSILKTKDLNESLNTTSSNGEQGVANEQFLLKTGFIRKQKLDKSFSFINILNERTTNIANNNLSLDHKPSKLYLFSYCL